MKDQLNRMVNERDFRQAPDYVAADKEKEKLILKLGTMITDRYLVKYTNTMKTDDPEYWALNAVLTKEEAQVHITQLQDFFSHGWDKLFNP